MGKWIPWMQFPLSWLRLLLWEFGWSGVGDKGHHGPCPRAEASEQALRASLGMDDSVFIGYPYCIESGCPLTCCSQVQCPMTHQLLVPRLESHSPSLTSGLYRLYQAFTQHSKVLQDRFYVGQHHKLPTLRHHHASLYAGSLKRLGLEAAGLPENTNHLSTMPVIEEKRQIIKGLLERTECKQDYNSTTGT